MQEIEEIVSRLRKRNYALRDVREAADLIAGLQNHDHTFDLAKRLRRDDSGQVRILGLCLLNALSSLHPPSAESIRGFSTDECRHLEAIRRLDPQKEPVTTPYPGIVSVIKCWLQESKAASRRLQ